MAWGNFWQKLENAFFGLVSKLILGALFDRSLPFFQHVLFMKSLIHILYHRERILETSTLSCNEEKEEVTKPPKR
jgi:hypothetical protein